MGVIHDDVKDMTDSTMTTPTPLSNNSEDFTPSGNEKSEEQDRQSNQSDQGEIASGGNDYPYPTGFRLALLAGASIMGVFLISLDQVSKISTSRSILFILAGN